MIFLILRSLIPKDIGPVIGDKGTTVFPLRVAGFAGFWAVDLKPPAFANAFARSGDASLPPGNDSCRFGLVLGVVEAIVVGEGNIEGVLLRNKAGGQEPGAKLRVGIVVSTKVRLPICVPRRFAVWGRVVWGGLLANPKDGRGD